VNLSENQVRKGSPGAGGWPTIRYFNKKTGYEGAAYAKKTSDAMCTELGPGKPYMQQHVEEMGETTLCSAATEAECGDKEKKFIAQWKAKSQDDVSKQVKRLSAMDGTAMKPELNTWRIQRLSILKQLRTTKDEL